MRATLAINGLRSVKPNTSLTYMTLLQMQNHLKFIGQTQKLFSKTMFLKTGLILKDKLH